MTKRAFDKIAAGLTDALAVAKQTTAADRARVAFGQSVEMEAWAVRQNELAWRARSSRLQAFMFREAGLNSMAERHEKVAEGYERQMKQNNPS